MRTRPGRDGQRRRRRPERPMVRTTPEAIDLQRMFAEMRDGGRRRGRDGGLLARARAAPRRRDPLGRGALHEPHPGPPRLPPDDGGLLPRQAPPARGRPGSRGHQRRRRLRRAAGLRVPADAVRIERVDCAPPRSAPRGSGATRAGPPSTSATSNCARRSPAASTSSTCWRRRRRPALGVDDATIAEALAARRRACPAASSRSTRARPSPCSSTTPTRPDSLENVLRAARDADRAGRVIVVFGAAATATAPSAR